mgnify:CR=1 FL=1
MYNIHKTVEICDKIKYIMIKPIDSSVLQKIKYFIQVIFKNVTHYSVPSSILCLVWKHAVSLHQLLGKPEISNPLLHNSRFELTIKRHFHTALQALRYRIWDLGLGSKTCYNGKIWAFWTKSGLFWDHFGTFLGLFVVILMILPQNNTED